MKIYNVDFWRVIIQTSHLQDKKGGPNRGADKNGILIFCQLADNLFSCPYSWSLRFRNNDF
jgi:hypothetical protein